MNIRSMRNAGDISYDLVLQIFNFEKGSMLGRTPTGNSISQIVGTQIIKVALTAKNLIKLPKLGKTKCIAEQTLICLHLSEQELAE